jgi:hypothetical protein
VSAPVEVPADIVERIRALCLALPEVTVRVDVSLSRARSTAHSFDVRRRSFCLLVAREDSTGKRVPLLVMRADRDEREALLSTGHPFYASRAGRDRIVVVLSDATDWTEIRELVTESYRILAPKKLTDEQACLDGYLACSRDLRGLQWPGGCDHPARLDLRPVLVAQAGEGDQRCGFGAVVRNVDSLDVCGVRDGGGGKDVLPGLGREDVGGRIDRRRVDAEEVEDGRVPT